MKYSITLDLLLASLSAASKGKHKTAAKMFDAALHAKDSKATIAALDKAQGEALATLKKEKATAAKAPVKSTKKPETATERMSSFLEEIAKKREEAKKAKKKPVSAKGKKKVKAGSDQEEFDSTIDEMTEASAGDELDPALDLQNPGADDDPAEPGDAIDRSGPAVSGPEKADVDPSNGMGESDLDTDLDDAMDLDDLADLSEEDFLAAENEDDEPMDDGEGDTSDEDSDENPFAEEDATPTTAKADKTKAFTRTIGNLAALDRLSALTASLVDGKKPVKAAAKPAAKAAKPASKK